jgi:electron transfer flavoprotein beta subunit
MQILVCISNVPDTTTKIRFSNDNSQVDLSGVQWIINPWDELALTRAVELKEDASNPVSRVTVLTVGKATAEPTLRKALAIGADDAIRVDADPADAFYVARQIASVLKNDGFDMIMSGIESSDYNGSSVGGMVAEILEIPSVSAVSAVNFENGEPVLTREIDGGKEQVTVQVPFMAIVQKGIAREPRIAAMRGIMMARQKPLKVVPAVEAEPLSQCIGYYLPEPKAPCRMLGADQVKELVNLLQNEAKAI